MTYLGGSAGDLFAASANGISVDLGHKQHLGDSKVLFSLKILESSIVAGQVDLGQAIEGLKHTYVTTHLYEPLRSLGLPSISIIFERDTVIETVILRQMQLQALSMYNQTGTFDFLLKELLRKRQWSRAAELWFEMARDKWRKELQHRRQNPLPDCTTLCFDALFTTDFVSSLEDQGWSDASGVLAHNHDHWLEKNRNFSRDITLREMSQRLCQITGMEYQP